MHLFLQMSKLQETTSYFDENAGRVGVKSDTVIQGHNWRVSRVGNSRITTCPPSIR